MYEAAEGSFHILPEGKALTMRSLNQGCAPQQSSSHGWLWRSIELSSGLKLGPLCRVENGQLGRGGPEGAV